MHIHIYKDRRGDWRWTLIAANGKKVACSGEGYKRRRYCQAIALRLCGVHLAPRGRT